MPDAVLSTASSSLAALLSGANADSPPASGASARGADPFAALLAHATGTRTPASPAKPGSADALTALLASVAPVGSAAFNAGAAAVVSSLPVATPVADAIQAANGETIAAAAPAGLPSAAKDSAADMVDPDLTPTALPTFPVAGKPTQASAAALAPVKAGHPAIPATPAIPAAETVPVEIQTAATAPKDKSSDRDDVPSRKDDSEDPLGDAIASGATAVLALAPAIVVPVQPERVVQPPVRIDAPAAAQALKLPTRAALSAPALVKTQAQLAPADAAADQAAAQLGASSAQADADARQQATTDAKPAAIQLPPEAAKAVTAALKQNDGAPLTALPADPATDETARAVAPKPQPEQPQQPVVKQAQQQQAAVPAQAPVRRRSDETPAPPRAGNARKRVDPAVAEAAGTPERAAETPRTGFALGTSAAAKGDAIIEQTLTIAKDGAWLDRLAKDIAGAGSGNDLHFKLNPENLGALSVAISQKDDGASIRLTADNQATHDILVDAQPKLIAEAHAQGLKVSDTQVDLRQDAKQNQNQSSNQDGQRWAQNQNGQTGQQAQTGQNGHNRQSSPEHKPFVSNLGRKANEDSESPDRDSDALYA